MNMEKSYNIFYRMSKLRITSSQINFIETNHVELFRIVSLEQNVLYFVDI